MPNSYASLVGDRRTHPCVRGFRVPRRLYDLAHQQFEADAEFMALSRQDVPAFIEEIDLLRSAIQECRAAIAELLLERPQDVSADSMARVKEFLEAEEARWADGQVRTRKLYLSQPPLRARAG